MARYRATKNKDGSLDIKQVKRHGLLWAIVAIPSVWLAGYFLPVGWTLISTQVGLTSEKYCREEVARVKTEYDTEACNSIIGALSSDDYKVKRNEDGSVNNYDCIKRYNRIFRSSKGSPYVYSAKEMCGG